jgi:hypothetical protein
LGEGGVAGSAEYSDGGVAERGHDSWVGAGVEVGGVLGEGDVARVVQAVFDAPMCA